MSDTEIDRIEEMRVENTRLRRIIEEQDKAITRHFESERNITKENERLRRLIRDAEWGGAPQDDLMPYARTCPWCKGTSHGDDCGIREIAEAAK